MKPLRSMIAISMLGSAALAQETPPSVPPAPPSPPAAIEKPAPQPVDAQTRDKVENLLDEVAKAYKQDKTITDTVKLSMSLPDGNSQSQEMSIVLGQGTNASLDMADAAMTALDGKLYIINKAVEDKYLVTDLEGDFVNTVESKLGQATFMPVAMTMRSLESTEANDQIGAILGVPAGETTIIGFGTVQNRKGENVHEVKVHFTGGSGQIHISPDTKFVNGVQLELELPNTEKPMNVELEMSPKVSDEPAKIAFDAGNRKAVTSLDELVPTPVSEGSPAPAFTLQTLDGQTVTSENLKGSVIVLDFWATWCPPCVRGLPMLQEFATWAETSDINVKVFPIATQDNLQKVTSFWQSKKFTMPTLLDLDGKVYRKYGFSAIPATVIIDPNGTVFKVHIGMPPNVVETLKKEVSEAAGAAQTAG